MVRTSSSRGRGETAAAAAAPAAAAAARRRWQQHRHRRQARRRQQHRHRRRHRRQQHRHRRQRGVDRAPAARTPPTAASMILPSTLADARSLHQQRARPAQALAALGPGVRRQHSQHLRRHLQRRAGGDGVQRSGGARLLGRCQRAARAGPERLAARGQRRGDRRLGRLRGQAGAVRQLRGDARRGRRRRPARPRSSRRSAGSRSAPRWRPATRASPATASCSWRGSSNSDGAQAVISAMLQSPYFLYRSELGKQSGSTLRADALRGRQRARLHADRHRARQHAALTAADSVNSGSMTMSAMIDAQATRLVASGAASNSTAVMGFMNGWLGLPRLFTTAKDTTVYTMSVDRPERDADRVAGPHHGGVQRHAGPSARC